MAHVVFELGDGTRHRLVQGDQIGRSATAALALDDRRVSAAHAQIAHRPGGLVLLALRGEVVLNGEPVDDVLLSMGQRFVLPDGTTLCVVDVEHSTGAIGVEATERVDDAPLRLTARFETVQVEGGALRRPVVLAGLGALILIELIRAGEPVHWHRVARRIWPLSKGQSVAEHKEAVRGRWYQATARLRRELAEGGLDRPLLEARSGTLILLLLPDDVVVDETD